MLFNSISFALFFLFTFLLYWNLQRNLKLQNVLLLIGSYFFYGCWDYRFLALLLFSTLLDFYTGIKISGSQKATEKKIWFVLSITINLGFLGVFKYYNFFIESFAFGLNRLGISSNFASLELILPVGISFYTFHGLSYVIDIYKNRIKTETNFIDYALFVSFFPLLVAGPIERATHLLPQMKQLRKFDYAKAADGLRQIIWGLFKKMVIADNCAEIANQIFSNHFNYPGSTLLLGAVFFTFQIYGDFSGYSDIALGTARLLGFELLQNFNFPYFSRDIAEFWRRWHISLSTWFRDYLYIPLGGSSGGMWMKIRNTFIIFLVSGFWHGANWTFIAWGLINAIYFLPLLIFNKNRNNLNIVAQGKVFPTFKEFLSILTTFVLAVFAWIFFRSETIKQAIQIIHQIFSSSFFNSPNLSAFKNGYYTLIFVLIFMLIEWFGREGRYGIAHLHVAFNKPLRYLFYYLLIGAIIWFGGREQQFIYFQF
jgi:alginate O-acetyltransferase complex protein AlgI